MSQRARASTLVDGAGWPQARAAGRGAFPARRPCAHTAAHVDPSTTSTDRSLPRLNFSTGTSASGRSKGTSGFPLL